MSEINQRAIDTYAPYSNGLEHISDELKRLDLLIQLLLNHHNGQTTNPLDQFKGLVLSEEEISGLLTRNSGLFTNKNLLRPGDPENMELEEALGQLESQIQGRRASSQEKGVYLSLTHISQIFKLTPFEEQCLLICLAPELDLKYERIYAYLQDDITRKKPGVGMVFTLLCRTMQEKIEARIAFDPQAPLFRCRLVQFTDGSSDGASPLISRTLKLDDRIVNFLLGFGRIDARIDSFVDHIPSRVADTDTSVSEDMEMRLKNFIKSHLKDGESKYNLVFYLHGPKKAGKFLLVAKVCGDLGFPLITADLEKMVNGPLSFDDAAWFLGRESLLQQSALCIEHLDCLLTEDGKDHHVQLRTLFETLKGFTPLLFVTGNIPWKPAGFMEKDVFIPLEFHIPDEETRRRVWEKHLGLYQCKEGVDADELAGKFRLSPGQIKDAVFDAQNNVMWRSPGEVQITMEALNTACKAQSIHRLITLASKVSPKYTWNDIVLPPLQKSQIRDICGHFRHRHTVYGEWGFDRKLSLGKGLNILFSGQPGTGKSMAAEVIANELSLDLFKIDLSQVVSKYIGDTEKNLNRIFAEARNSSAILFFDEADALFGKRSEVKDAHDRYANIEVAYLLQKMEEYDGIVILATNMRGNMDEAFARRMHFTVEFPFPDEDYREKIWMQMLPPEMPLSTDIDFSFLSRQFKFSGGNIKNIVLSAAFLAASDGRKVRMDHMIMSVQRELLKTGKLCVKGDFGSYYDLLGKEDARHEYISVRGG